MNFGKGIFIQVEGELGEVWRRVKEINLGSLKNPNKKIKQVKIIT